MTDAEKKAAEVKAKADAKAAETAEKKAAEVKAKADAEAAKKKKAKKKVKFLKSPTGSHKLAYYIGDEASLAGDLADELIEKKIAEAV